MFSNYVFYISISLIYKRMSLFFSNSTESDVPGHRESWDTSPQLRPESQEGSQNVLSPCLPPSFVLFLKWIPVLNTRKLELKQGSRSVDWWSACNCLCKSVKVQYVYFFMSMCLNISCVRKKKFKQTICMLSTQSLRHSRAAGLIFLCQLKIKMCREHLWAF